jgi:eukaryotic-like serine/threonine-protein kinase
LENFELEERIGKYPVIKEIGSGATSRVFLARDTFADRDVAIKVYLFDEADGVNAKLLRKGFLAEAGLAGKLVHPHIVEIYDAVSEPEYSYLVMEYVPGSTLEQYAEGSKLLPLGKVVEIIFKCIRAMDFAFQHGVIHRDLKPGNILISPEGEIKVSDFGASFQNAQGHETTQIIGIGSPAYMSPEQILMEDLNQQTDIYSLGVVMYKLLTGRLPYNASNQISLAHEILNVAPIPPSTYRPGMPPLLEEIILRAIAKNRDDRYATWIDFGKDLSKAFTSLRLAGESVSDSEKFQTLRDLPFFEDFDDVELWEVLRISSWKTVDAGTTVIREGEQGDGFYLLLDGEVEVTLRGKQLNTIKHGGCFGEILYFSDRITTRTTTITALAGITAVEIKAKAMKAASDACQVGFNKALIRVLIDRLTQANARLVER